MLERIDYTWERHRWYTGVNNDVRPSDLFRDHIFGCFIYDHAGLVDARPDRRGQHHVRERLPALRQQLARTAAKMLAESLADVPDDEAREDRRGQRPAAVQLPPDGGLVTRPLEGVRILEVAFVDVRTRRCGDRPTWAPR